MALDESQHSGLVTWCDSLEKRSRNKPDSRRELDREI